MKGLGAALAVGWLHAVAPAAVWAQDPAPESVAPDGEQAPLDERLQALEEELRLTRSFVVGQKPNVVIGGFLDFGLFVPQGNGSGVLLDSGPRADRVFPRYADQYGWVFLGDLLAPAVNTRGEPADLGDLPGVIRHDAIDSNGAPGFVVNEVNVRLNAAVADNALVTTSINFTPRNGSNFSLGDLFDVDLAQLEWMVGASRRTSIFIGKVEPVLGIEYRERKADRRVGITPSLLARYTTGSPLGLKVRSKFGPAHADDLLTVAAAITNGSSGTELFHFHDEIDSNAAKTASGRVALRPTLPFGLELGASGEFGAQDHALDSARSLWFFGVDLQATVGRFALKAQWLRGSGEGEDARTASSTAQRPYGLRLNNGAYVELNAGVGSMLTLLARGEFRDALVWLGDPTAPGGAERLYVTKSWRATIGARLVINQHVTSKIEFLRNGEYGGIPEVRNDVFTASLVLSY